METGVSYFSSRDLRHVRADLADMMLHRCSYVVHTLTESDLAHDAAAMAEIARLSRDAGLEVWYTPWGVAGLFGGETVSRFLLDHPESWQVRSDGRSVPAACPHDPELRRYLREWIGRAADLGGQVVLWDEPRFWTDTAKGDERWTCLCALCRDAFRDRFHTTMPAVFTEEVRRFREETLLALLADLNRAAHRAGLRTALTLRPSDLAQAGFHEAERRLLERINLRRRRDGEPLLEGTPPSLRHAGIQDWQAAAALPDLDVVGCSPYWWGYQADAGPFLRAYVERMLRAARLASEYGGRRLGTQVWLQAFGVPAGRESELWTAVQSVARMGVTHVAAWSYAGGTAMSLTRSERPDVVWKVVGDAFRAVTRR
jgi:CRP-like cAMP-binding protein